MSERAYDGMSHDEILRVHAERYAKLSPEEKALQSEERAKAEREKLLAEAQRLSQPLSELTLGDLISAIEEALKKSVVPKLQEIVDALHGYEHR